MSRTEKPLGTVVPVFTTTVTRDEIGTLILACEDETELRLWWEHLMPDAVFDPKLVQQAKVSPS